MKYSVLLASLLVLWSACTKSDTPDSREEMLRGKWKLTASKKTYFYVPTQRDTTYDYFRELPDCYKDDILEFKSVYSGEVNYGNLACSPAEQLTNAITWQVLQNDTALEVNYAPQYFFQNQTYLRNGDPMRGVFVGDVTASAMTLRYRLDSMDAQGRPHYLIFENTYAKQ